MDRMLKKIPNTRIHFAKLFGDCDYKMLMGNQTVGKSKLNEYIIQKYDELNKGKRWLMLEQQQNNSSRKQAESYALKYIRKELLKVANSKRVTDVLVHYLYKVKDSKNKDTLWGCFGKEILDNLKANLNKIKPCVKCENMIEKKQGKMYCEHCAKENEKERKKNARKKNIKKVI
ncbi:hypothetical protein [Paenibacillus naphthalenovorans]|uniref:hypothetical protein n=1 Tax=Paenibacillus naphthalenovorans TaxID=162209 RepID=UPI003D2C9DDD